MALYAVTMTIMISSLILKDMTQSHLSREAYGQAKMQGLRTTFLVKRRVTEIHHALDALIR